jgi:NADPH:quinone reductase-like Zn-dependent oxidoreductase
MHALVTAGQGQLPTVQLVPTPQIETHEILVKVAAVALNPYDWKIISTVKATTPGLILGIDLSGTVVAVGESVNGFRIGERVAAFVHGGDDKSVGAFAEYAKADAELVWHIPDITTFEEASTMNCGFVILLAMLRGAYSRDYRLWTAIQALVHKPRLGLTRRPVCHPARALVGLPRCYDHLTKELRPRSVARRRHRYRLP